MYVLVRALTTVGLALVLALAASPGRAQVTERVSVASDGTQANDRNYSWSLSADGRFVAFVSAADNLVAVDTRRKPHRAGRHEPGSEGGQTPAGGEKGSAGSDGACHPGHEGQEPEPHS